MSISFWAITCLNFELSAKNSRWLALSLGNWGSSMHGLERGVKHRYFWQLSTSGFTYIPKYRLHQELFHPWWHAQWYCCRSIKLFNSKFQNVISKWVAVQSGWSYLCFSLYCVKHAIHPNLPDLRRPRTQEGDYRYSSTKRIVPLFAKRCFVKRKRKKKKANILPPWRWKTIVSLFDPKWHNP